MARNIHSCVALGNLNYVHAAILTRKYLRKVILNEGIKSWITLNVATLYNLQSEV